MLMDVIYFRVIMNTSFGLDAVLILKFAPVVSIPKTAVLSIKNCSLAEHIPQVIYGKEAQLGLALALYGEL